MCKFVRWIHPTKESFRWFTNSAETAAEKSERGRRPTFDTKREKSFLDTSASKVLFYCDCYQAQGQIQKVNVSAIALMNKLVCGCIL